jgi:MATE family multidrug resistance protein
MHTKDSLKKIELKNDIGLKDYKNELKILLPLGIPAIFSQLAQMATSFIDSLMAGHHSMDALAAIAIGGSIFQPILVFFTGFFLSLNPIIAHFKGKGEIKSIASHFNMALLMALLLSPIAIAILLKTPFILEQLNIAEPISSITQEYILATLWGWPCLMGFLAIRFFNEGLFSTKAIMITTLFSLPFNVLFNAWFMYGGYGINAMGVVGIGYSTALTWCVMFFGLLIYTLKTPKYHIYHLCKKINFPSLKAIKAIFYLGLPLAFTLGFEVTLFASISLMIAKYPTEVIAAHQIALNLASLFFMIPLGFSQAITARVAYFRAQNKIQSMKIAGSLGIILSFAMMVFSASLMMLIPTYLMAIYTDSTELLEIGVGLLLLAGLFQFPDGLQAASLGCLRGIKDTRSPMFITAIAYWGIAFPIGYYLAEYQHYGVRGYWIGLIIGLTVSATLLCYRWIIYLKKNS